MPEKKQLSILSAEETASVAREQSNDQAAIDAQRKDYAVRIVCLLNEAMQKRKQRFQAALQVTDVFSPESSHELSIVYGSTPEEQEMLYNGQISLMLETIRELETRHKTESGSFFAANVLKQSCLSILYSAGCIQDDFKFDIIEVEKLTRKMIINSLRKFIENLRNYNRVSEMIVKSASAWFESGFVALEEVGTTEAEFKDLISKNLLLANLDTDSVQ